MKQTEPGRQCCIILSENITEITQTQMLNLKNMLSPFPTFDGVVALLRSPAQLVPVPLAQHREALTHRSLAPVVVLIVPRDQLVLVPVMVVEEEAFVGALVSHSLLPAQGAVWVAGAVLLEVHLVGRRTRLGLVQVKLQLRTR